MFSGSGGYLRKKNQGEFGRIGMLCSVQGSSVEPLAQIKQQIKQDQSKKPELLRATHVTGLLGVLNQLTQLSQFSVCSWAMIAI